MELPRELEEFINEYFEHIKKTNYAKKILLKGSRDLLSNLRRYINKSLTVKMLPTSMDKDEAPNLFIGLQNLIKESQKIIEDTYTRNVIDDKEIVFAFRITSIPETDILGIGTQDIQSFSIKNKKFYLIKSTIRIRKRKKEKGVDYSYVILLYLVSKILGKIRGYEKSGEPNRFSWYKNKDDVLKSFTVHAYSGLSTLDIYEIEISDIHWLYENYFKKDLDPFDFVKGVLSFIVDFKKDKIILDLLNKLSYVFLNYRKVDEELLDVLYGELFKRAKKYLKEKNKIFIIPKPHLIMVGSEVEEIYKKGYEIGKLFREKEEREFIEKIVLALKSERDPNSFRDKLLNYLITGKTMDKNVLLPEEFFKKDISGKEFLAMKNSFLAGLWNGSHSKSENESKS